jgi:hypothetical protein
MWSCIVACGKSSSADHFCINFWEEWSTKVEIASHIVKCIFLCPLHSWSLTLPRDNVCSSQSRNVTFLGSTTSVVQGMLSSLGSLFNPCACSLMHPHTYCSYQRQLQQNWLSLTMPCKHSVSRHHFRVSLTLLLHISFEFHSVLQHTR